MLYKNKEWLEKKYLEERLSIRKTAKLSGSGVITIYNWLKKFNIPIRSKSEARKGKTLSTETKRKISETNKGKVRSKEARQKYSEINLNNPNCGFQKGYIPWNKGGTHTKQTRIKISESHKGKMPGNTMVAGKYGNIKRGWYNINGKEMFFRSIWEANYALYLDFLINQKQIEKWTYEKDVFMFEKIKLGTRSYRPDFKIYNLDNTFEYHEVKGYMDAKSKTKIKRMAKYYPNIKLIIIDKPIYEDIKKKLGKMLKFF